MAYEIESPQEIERIARVANYIEAMRAHFGPASFDERLMLYTPSLDRFLFEGNHSKQMEILGQVVHFLIYHGDWENNGEQHPETSEQHQAQGDT